MQSVQDPAQLIARVPDWANLAGGLLARRDRRRYSSLSEFATRHRIDRRSLPGLLTAFQPPSRTRPVLLLPVRLETRFVGTKLLVRIFPEPIAIESLQRELTVAELEHSRSAREELARSDGDHQAAWRELVATFGARRAAWILRRAAEYERDEAEPRPTDGARPAITRILPDHFVVTAVPSLAGSTDQPYSVTGAPITTDFPIHPLARGQAAIGRSSSAWLSSFDRAQALGMAVTIELRAEHCKGARVHPGLIMTRVTAVGMRTGSAATGQRVFEELLEDHCHAAGLSFVSVGTATSNSREQSSEHSPHAEIADQSFTREAASVPPVVAPDGCAARLATALGIDVRLLARTEGANLDRDDTLRDLTTALWPATGDYLLGPLSKAVAELPERGWLADHVAKFVRSEGPLPCLRVGDVLYGVLPAAAVQRWQASEHDLPLPRPNSTLEVLDRTRCQALFELLDRLRKSWQRSSLNAVPRLTSSDTSGEQLLRVLAMEPVPVRIHGRLMIDEGGTAGLLATLALMAAGGYPWFGSASSNWQNEVAARQSILAALAGAGDFRPLAELTAWGEPWEVRDLELVDASVREFQWLSNSRPPTVRTLLYELLAHALKLDGQQPVGSRRVSDAIERLSRAGGPIVRPTRTPIRTATRTTTPTTTPTTRASRTPVSPIRISSVAEQLKPALARQPLDHAQIDRWLRGFSSLCSNRLDAWFTSLISKRLAALRHAEPTGLHLGLYGYVEDLAPSRSNSLGYIHAPSSAQAKMAAVLFGSHEREPEAYGMELRSERVRRALALIAAARQGSPLPEVLGFIAEAQLARRDLELNAYVDELHQRFSLVANRIPDTASDADASTVAAITTLDGLELARSWRSRDPASWPAEFDFVAVEHRPMVAEVFDDLVDSLDAVGDVLVGEGMYHAVRSNFERAAAALDAAAARGPFPEIESMATPAPASSLSQRVLLLLPEGPPPEPWPRCDPRSRAEPGLSAWIAEILGDPRELGLEVRGRVAGQLETISILNVHDLGLGPLDLLALAEAPSSATEDGGRSELEALVRWHLRGHLAASPELDTSLQLDLDSAPGLGRTLGDALELVRAVAALVGASRHLGPGSLSPDQADEAWATAEIAELRVRVEATLAELSWLEQALALSPGTTGCRASVTAEALLLAARFGIRGAVPQHLDPAVLDSRRRVTAAEVASRTEACRAELARADQLAGQTADTATDIGGRVIEALIAALRAVFGEDFVVVPRFDVRDRQSLRRALDQQLAHPKVDRARVELWLRQCAEVRLPLRHLDDLLILYEAWQRPDDDQPMELAVAQWTPGTDAIGWLALSDEELGGRPRPAHGQALVLIAEPGSLAPTPTRVGGLSIDQWEDRVPLRELDTVVAFHHPRPSAQAPACLLLAVPDTHDPHSRERWTEAQLEATVVDTIALAKLRAVDLDALPDLAGAAPGMYLPLFDDSSGLPLDKPFKDWLRELG